MMIFILLLAILPAVLSQCTPFPAPVNQTVSHPVYFPTLGSGDASAVYVDNAGNINITALNPLVTGRTLSSMYVGSSTNANCRLWSASEHDSTTCLSTIQLSGKWDNNTENGIRGCPGWQTTVSGDSVILKNYVFVEWTDVMDGLDGNVRTHRTALELTLNQQRDVVVESSAVPITLEEARLVITRVVYVPGDVGSGNRRYEVDYQIVAPCPLTPYFSSVEMTLQDLDSSTSTTSTISNLDVITTPVVFKASQSGQFLASSTTSCSANQRYATHTGTLYINAPEGTCYADGLYQFNVTTNAPSVAYTGRLEGWWGQAFDSAGVKDGSVGFGWYSPNNTAKALMSTSTMAVTSGGVYWGEFNRIRRLFNGTITHFAGSTTGLAGTTDGTLLNARFGQLEAVAADKQGNLYVLDSTNRNIRRINSTHVQTLVNLPTASWYGGLAIDDASNLYYIAERTIRKVTLSVGSYTDGFLVGGATSGYMEGPGNVAQFTNPGRLTAAGDGTLYLVDNYRVRRVSPSGVVSLFAGMGNGDNALDGAVATARFKMPADLALDDVGNLFIGDYGPSGPIIRKISNGFVTTIAVSSNFSLTGLTLDAGAVVGFPMTYTQQLEYYGGKFWISGGDTGYGSLQTIAGAASSPSSPVYFGLNATIEDGFNFCAADSLNATLSAEMVTLGMGPFSVGSKVSFAGNLTTSGLPPAQIYLRTAIVYNTKTGYASAGRYPKAVYQSATGPFSTFGTSTEFKAKFVDSLGDYFSGAVDPETGGWTSVSTSHLHENTDPSIYQAGVARPFLAQVIVIGGTDLTSSYLIPSDFGTTGNGFSLELGWRVYFDLTTANLGQRKRSDIKYLYSRTATIQPFAQGDAVVESTATLQGVEKFTNTTNVNTGLPIGAIAGIAVGGIALIVAMAAVGVFVSRKKRKTQKKSNKPTKDQGFFMTQP